MRVVEAEVDQLWEPCKVADLLESSNLWTAESVANSADNECKRRRHMSAEPFASECSWAADLVIG